MSPLRNWPGGGSCRFDRTLIGFDRKGEGLHGLAVASLSCRRSAVRQHGGRVRKCLTILFHFTSSFVSFITFFFFCFVLNARSYA